MAVQAAFDPALFSLDVAAATGRGSVFEIYLGQHQSKRKATPMATQKLDGEKTIDACLELQPKNKRGGSSSVNLVAQVV